MRRCPHEMLIAVPEIKAESDTFFFVENIVSWGVTFITLLKLCFYYMQIYLVMHPVMSGPANRVYNTYIKLSSNRGANNEV